MTIDAQWPSPQEATSELPRVVYDCNGIPMVLPLMEALKTRLAVDRLQPLRGFMLVAIQHLQGSVVPLVNALESAGIEYDNMFLVGKAYSAHGAVLRHLVRLGCNVRCSRSMRSSSNPYEREIGWDIESVLDHAVRLMDVRPGCSALVLDEGGKATELVHAKYARYLSRFHFVEQTTRGIRAIERFTLRTPVIDVARSDTKKELEAPMIATSMADQLESQLNRWLNIIELQTRTVLIIGYGVVGRQLALQLKLRHYDVLISERDPTTARQASADGFQASEELDNALASAEIIIGCTGSMCIPFDSMPSIGNNALLVNGASSDIEFSAWKLRTRAEVIHTRSTGEVDDPLLKPWMNLYRVNNRDRTYFLSNGGFPVNFGGQMDTIPAEQFQITRTLMFMGGLQAAATTTPGIVPLSRGLQRTLNEYMSMIKTHSV